MSIEDDPVEVEGLPLVPVGGREHRRDARDVRVPLAETHLDPGPMLVPEGSELVVHPERRVDLEPMGRRHRRQEVERDVRLVAQPDERLEEMLALDDRRDLPARDQHVGDTLPDPAGQGLGVHAARTPLTGTAPTSGPSPAASRSRTSTSRAWADTPAHTRRPGRPY